MLHFDKVHNRTVVHFITLDGDELCGFVERGMRSTNTFTPRPSSSEEFQDSCLAEACFCELFGPHAELPNAVKPADAGVCTTSARTIDACPSLTALSSACCNSLTTFTPCCELGSFEPADTSASGRRSEATPSPGKKGVARSWSRQFSCLSLTSGSPGPGGNSCCMQGLLCTQH